MLIVILNSSPNKVVMVSSINNKKKKEKKQISGSPRRGPSPRSNNPTPRRGKDRRIWALGRRIDLHLGEDLRLREDSFS